jgi:plastocyanin
MPRMFCHRFRTVFRAFMWVGLFATSAPVDAGPPVSTDVGTASQEEVVVITIRGREFAPLTVVLHAGRQTTLAFYNRDAELHAFVPIGLLTGTHLSVSGTGAPEFSTEGLQRVIIPSEGKVDIRFIPDRPGRYPYFCDMPGHDMKALIIVE